VAVYFCALSNQISLKFLDFLRRTNFLFVSHHYGMEIACSIGHAQDKENYCSTRTNFSRFAIRPISRAPVRVWHASFN
jgi:hypothetical protein